MTIRRPIEENFVIDISPSFIFDKVYPPPSKLSIIFMIVLLVMTKGISQLKLKEEIIPNQLLEIPLMILYQKNYLLPDRFGRVVRNVIPQSFNS